MLKKIARTWGDDTYSYLWSTAEIDLKPISWRLNHLLPTMSQVAQYFHIFLLVFTVVGCVRIFQRPAQNRHIYGYFLTIILGITLLHTILEAQPRYHYVFTPLLLILASLGIVGNAVHSDPA